MSQQAKQGSDPKQVLNSNSPFTDEESQSAKGEFKGLTEGY